MPFCRFPKIDDDQYVGDEDDGHRDKDKEGRVNDVPNIVDEEIPVRIDGAGVEVFFLAFKLSDVVIILQINVKMPTIVGLLTIMSRIKFIPSRF